MKKIKINKTKTKNPPQNNHQRKMRIFQAKMEQKGGIFCSIKMEEKKRVENKNKKMLQTSGAAVRHHTAIFPYFKNDHNSTDFFCYLLFRQQKTDRHRKTTAKKPFDLCIFWS